MLEMSPEFLKIEFALLLCLTAYNSLFSVILQVLQVT